MWRGVGSRAVRVLITGVTGFAGRHLAALCVGSGDEVHGVVRPGREEAAPDGVTAHPADVTDAGAVAGVLEGSRPDAIVHLAGMASVGQSFAEPLETWRVNLWGTLGVLEALLRSGAGTRCVVVTSGEIYGRVAEEDLPVGPEHPLRPLSPYGASKAAADLAAGQYRAAHGLDVVRVRAFNQIGPGQDARFVLPSVCRQIVAAEGRGLAAVEIRVGNVDTRRDFTDVRDMARAYRLLAERGGGGEPYQACSGRSLAVRELVEGVARLSRVPATVRSDAGLRREGEQPDLYGSRARLEADTGWAPAIPLTDTLRDTLDWWRAREEGTSP
jgi:GDP-4-dehydro-6-deoxy-D-mannose reductase